MRGQPADPNRGQQRQVLPVEHPLVVHNDQPSGHKTPNHQPQREVVYGREREPEPRALSPEKQVDVEEAEGVAETVPPQVDAQHGGDDGVQVMDIRTEQGHGCHLNKALGLV